MLCSHQVFVCHHQCHAVSIGYVCITTVIIIIAIIIIAIIIVIIIIAIITAMQLSSSS